MKKSLYAILIATIAIFAFFAVSALTVSKAHAEDREDVCPVTPPVTIYVDRPVDRIVYVDRPVIQTRTVTQTVPVEKIVKVEVPVYESSPATSDPKTIRAMMKVTHDRYLALLAKYRELMKAKKK